MSNIATTFQGENLLVELTFKDGEYTALATFKGVEFKGKSSDHPVYAQEELYKNLSDRHSTTSTDCDDIPF